jgi:predicted Zn-dependent protease
MNQPINDKAATYGFAITKTNEKKYNEASELVKQLLSKNSDNVLFLMAKAEILAGQKNYSDAERIVLRLYKDYPYNQALLTELAAFYLVADQPQKTRDLIKIALKRRTGSAILYSLLARSYVDLKDEKNAMISQGDYYAARWNYEAAIRQYQMAKKAKPINDYSTAIIDAKVKKLESLLSQQKKLEKEL